MSPSLLELGIELLTKKRDPGPIQRLAIEASYLVAESVPLPEKAPPFELFHSETCTAVGDLDLLSPRRGDSV